MIKLWRFLSVPIVLVVCLSLTLVPTALPGQGGVVSASSNVTIGVQPATTNVSFSEAFSITVEVDNPDTVPISIAAARLNFSTTYFSVTSITPGTTLNTVTLNQYDNVAGTIDYDAGILGGNTTSNPILVCTINCLSKSAAGTSSLYFVYTAPGVTPVRKTGVKYGPTKYIKGNMSLMNSGTVTVIGRPILWVDVTPAGKGNVTINGTLPPTYPNTTNYTWDDVVSLQAVNPAAGWQFDHWSGNLTGSTNPDNITMNGDKNVTAHFTPLAPVISPNQTSLTFSANLGGANPPNQTLGICNSGGGILNWTLNDGPGWLRVRPLSGGNLGTDDCNSTQVAVNISTLTTAGTYHANITINSTDIGVVNKTVPVILNLGVPAISTTPASLTFTTNEGENPPDQTLEVCNSGTGTLDWTATDDAAWLSESPTSGSLGAGECDDVTVSVDVSGMAVGDYSATITITGSDEETVPVSLHIVSAMPEIPVGPAQLSASSLSITPQQVNPGQEVTISVNVANTGGETGSYNAVLYINGVVEESQSVSVAGGASKNVIFTVTKSQAGVYDVSLAGQNGQFEVVSTGWFGGGLGTGGIIAIVVIVIVLIVALVFILRGTTKPE